MNLHVGLEKNNFLCYAYLFLSLLKYTTQWEMI